MLRFKQKVCSTVIILSSVTGKVTGMWTSNSWTLEETDRMCKLQKDELGGLMLHSIYIYIFLYLMTVGLSQLRVMPSKWTAPVPQRPN